MYLGHLLVARRELLEEVGGFDGEFDGIQDFELLLRLAERTQQFTTSPGSSITGGPSRAASPPARIRSRASRNCRRER